MARRTLKFRQQDVTRALKGTVAAGVDVSRVEIDKDGTIVIVAGKPTEVGENDGASEWDKV
jgi:hypothetical protein